MESKYFKIKDAITEKEEKQLSEYIKKCLEKRPGYVLGADSNENDKILDSLKALEKNELSGSIKPDMQKKVNAEIDYINSKINENYRKTKDKILTLLNLENELKKIINLIFLSTEEIKSFELKSDAIKSKNEREKIISKLRDREAKKIAIEQESEKVITEIEYLKKEMKNLEHRLNN